MSGTASASVGGGKIAEEEMLEKESGPKEAVW